MVIVQFSAADIAETKVPVLEKIDFTTKMNSLGMFSGSSPFSILI